MGGAPPGAEAGPRPVTSQVGTRWGRQGGGWAASLPSSPGSMPSVPPSVPTGRLRRESSPGPGGARAEPGLGITALSAPGNNLRSIVGIQPGDEVEREKELMGSWAEQVSERYRSCLPCTWPYLYKLPTYSPRPLMYSSLTSDCGHGGPVIPHGGVHQALQCPMERGTAVGGTARLFPRWLQCRSQWGAGVCLQEVCARDAEGGQIRDPGPAGRGLRQHDQWPGHAPQPVVSRPMGTRQHGAPRKGKRASS